MFSHLYVHLQKFSQLCLHIELVSNLLWLHRLGCRYYICTSLVMTRSILMLEYVLWNLTKQIPIAGFTPQMFRQGVRKNKFRCNHSKKCNDGKQQAAAKLPLYKMRTREAYCRQRLYTYQTKVAYYREWLLFVTDWQWSCPLRPIKLQTFFGCKHICPCSNSRKAAPKCQRGLYIRWG